MSPVTIIGMMDVESRSILWEMLAADLDLVTAYAVGVEDEDDIAKVLARVQARREEIRRLNLKARI